MGSEKEVKKARNNVQIVQIVAAADQRLKTKILLLIPIPRNYPT